MNLAKINKKILNLSILFFCLNSYSVTFSQDIITKTNGEEVEVKVELIGVDDIKYKKFNHLDGPSYIINKTDVIDIKFENGIIENFNARNKENDISLEETKEFIIKTINEHGFEEDTFKRKYRATFEGDYLRLIVLKKNGIDITNDGILYDFSNVYKFHHVSKRSDKLAFVNIWVSILKNNKKDKWDKHKLIMRVDGIPEAESILNALRHYNELLLAQNEKPNSKF